MNRKKSIPILLTSPTLIKRPIFETAAEILVGFNADVRDKL
ncbi:MAG: hypothetical protein LAT56_10245 [Wenzhouxiangella sp.]|nr:hypothetical protein [Wenzhouxiangella sp.]